MLGTLALLLLVFTDLDTGSGVRFYSPATSGDTVSLSQACTRTDTRTAGEYELLIKKGINLVDV